MSSARKMEGRVDALLAQLIECLDEQSDTQEPFDLSKWITFFTTDMISDLAFGVAFGCLRERSDTRGVVASLQGGSSFNALLSIFPIIGTALFSGPLSTVLKPPTTSGIGFAIKVCEQLIHKREPEIDS